MTDDTTPEHTDPAEDLRGLWQQLFTPPDNEPDKAQPPDQQQTPSVAEHDAAAFIRQLFSH